MKLHRKIRHGQKERGIALMVALLALALLAAIGIGFMFMADTENSINNNYRDAQKAYFAARAGAENVRALMAPGDPITGAGKGPLFDQVALMTMPAFNTPSGVIYVTNPNANDPANIVPTASAGATPSSDPYMDDEICQEQFVDFVNNGLTATPGPCWSGKTPQLISSSTKYFAPPTTALGSTNLPGTGGSSAVVFKWVRITNKQNLVGLLKRTLDSSTNNGLQVCFDGFKEVAIPAGQTCGGQFPQAMTPVWVLTSLAVTPGVGQNQGSRRMVQMETALTPPITAPAPIAARAPIVLNGQTVANAYDACNCTPAGTPLPGRTVGCASAIDAVYSAQTIDSNGASAQNLVSGSGATGTGAVAQNQPWPYDIDKMIQAYSASATPATGPPWNLSCNSTPDCGKLQGSNTVPFGTFPTAGLPGNPTGQSPMQVYIPGSVEFRADVSGAGLLIVNGDLTVDGGFSFYGLVLVKGHLKFEGGGSQVVNIYGAVLAGQDLADDADKIGGSFSFFYDTCALKQNQSPAPPRMLAMHEVMY